MNNAKYEVLQTLNSSGISFSYNTAPGGYHPLHWHEELEILYPLNGAADITIENKKYSLPNKQIMVIESCEVHSTYAHSSLSMFLCIHVSKKQLQSLSPDIELRRIRCLPSIIPSDLFPDYLEICRLMEQMTRLYIQDAPAFQLEAEGIILQVLARLIRCFSVGISPRLSDGDSAQSERIRQVISYVEEHFCEPVSLTDIASHIGLGKESFCRFFKKNMGISFLQYLSEVRLAHIYQCLVKTDLPVAEIAEKNGFTNQKLFNQSFKKLYGCTPSAVRKTISNNA